jgi:shikimate kinase
MKIVVTGPRSVGKSTASQLLAEVLEMPYVSSDALLDERLASQGGLVEVMKQGPSPRINEEGIALVEVAMARPDDFVFDLAGGAIGSPATRDSVLPCLRGAFVVGLLPCEDDDQSIELLWQREQRREHFQGADEGELRAKVERDYRRLKEPLVGRADRVIVTAAKSARDIVEEIKLALLDT